LWLNLSIFVGGKSMTEGPKHVVLTGGTGLVGSAVLRALIEAGHEVTAIVRSQDSADAVEKAGATSAIGELTDTAWLSAQFAAADGAIHTASPGDATSVDFDTAVVNAAVAAYRGTGKPFVHTGGVWVYGAGAAITEATPFDPPALTAWRADVEKILLDEDSVRGVVIAPAVVYGAGQGLPNLVTQPDDNGDFRLIGDGAQHWATVSADELGDLYVLALVNPDARGYYIGANDDHPTVRDLAEAAAAFAASGTAAAGSGAEAAAASGTAAAAASGAVVAESAQDSRDRLFAPLVDALLLDQVVSATSRARTELGWRPAGASLLEEIRSGAYASGT
jgi:nucleoside-diphosphate-sugar epimerase